MTFGTLVILLLAALLGGLIAGLTGLGGGIVYVLIYEKYFQLHPSVLGGDHHHLLVKAVIANSVFSITFATFIAVVKNYRVGHFFPKVLGYIAIPALLTAVGATYALTFTQAYSLKMFTLVFALFLLPFIMKVILTEEPPEDQKERAVEAPRLPLIITGLLSGIVMALGGLGGGVVIVPALNGILKIPIRSTIAVSLGVIAIASAGLTVYNMVGVPYELVHQQYSTGLIYYPLVLPVLVGVVFSSWLGVRWAQKTSPFILKILFVLLSLASIGSLAYDAFL